MTLSLARHGATLLVAMVLHAPIAAEAQPAAPIAALRTARNVSQRVSAIATVAVLRPEGATGALEEQLAHPSPLVRVAAVEGLRTLRDPSAVPALRRRARDRDPRVRSAVAEALRVLGPAVPGVATAVGPVPTDWRRVRCAVELGAMDDRVTRSEVNTDALRDGLRAAVLRSATVALDPGVLPPAGAARARTGALRVFDMNGSIVAITPTTPADSIAVHVEISILLLSEGGRSILGTIGTSASATEARLQAPGTSDPIPRLTRSALEAAAQGAVAQIESQCTSGASRR